MPEVEVTQQRRKVRDYHSLWFCFPAGILRARLRPGLTAALNYNSDGWQRRHSRRRSPAPISILFSFNFIRHYYWNHCYFLFLHLIDASIQCVALNKRRGMVWVVFFIFLFCAASRFFVGLVLFFVIFLFTRAHCRQRRCSLVGTLCTCVWQASKSKPSPETLHLKINTCPTCVFLR